MRYIRTAVRLPDGRYGNSPVFVVVLSNGQTKHAKYDFKRCKWTDMNNNDIIGRVDRWTCINGQPKGEAKRDFVKCSEDLPQVYEGTNQSIDVHIIFESGYSSRGYYDYDQDKWFGTGSCLEVKKEVIGWYSL